MTKNSITSHAIAFLILKAENVISIQRAEALLVQAENIHRAKFDHYLQGTDKINIDAGHAKAADLVQNGAKYDDLDELSVNKTKSLTKAHEQYDHWSDEQLNALPKTPNPLTPYGEQMEREFAHIHMTLKG